ncbi:MAG: HAMP domain-containing protein [Thermoguttaceae bacterium]|nr:HAMP domain-containing protein [Thermoguttaceae bacterium]
MRRFAKYFPQSLPVRLSLYICLLLLCFGTVGMTLIGYFWYLGLAFTLDDHARTVAREIALSMDQVFVQTEQSAQILATAIEHCDSDQAEVKQLVTAVLPSVNRHCGDIRGIAIAWREGQTGTAHKTGILFGYKLNGTYHFDFSNDKSDYLYKDWFVIPATLGGPVWTIPYREPDGLNSLLVSYAVPFYKQNKNGRSPAGVIVIDICIDDLAKFLNKNQITGLLRLADKSHLFLMNQFGQLVIDPEMEQAPGKTIFTICDEPDTPDEQDRKQAQRIFRSGSGRISFTKAPLLDVPSQMYYHRCVNGWVVSIVVPEDWKNGFLWPVFTRFMLAWLVAIAIVAVVIILICRRVNRPLLALSRAAEEVGRGNFNTQLPAVVVEDEIGQVTRSFGHMQMELADYIDQLRQTVSARSVPKENSTRRLKYSKAFFPAASRLSKDSNRFRPRPCSGLPGESEAICMICSRLTTIILRSLLAMCPEKGSLRRCSWW